jgi:RNA recognition motif-containing protein
MNIFVGNLSQAITEDDLRQAFEAFGGVASINVIKDRVSGRPRGFGFIEMPAKAEAQSAINGLNGSELKGQRINVNEARPRDEGRRGGRRRGGGRRF